MFGGIQKVFRGSRGAAGKTDALPEFEDGFVGKIAKQNYLIKESRLHDAFRSAKPIADQGALVGRDDLLERVNQILQAEGSHVILYGDRGVGKSSVGNVLLDVFQRTRHDEELFIYRCSAHTQLCDMIAGVLLHQGHDTNEIESRTREARTDNTSAGISAGTGMIGVSAGKRITEAVSSERLERSVRELANDPSWVAQKIHGIDGLVFIDELDKVADPNVKHQLATLVKAVSDYRSSRLNFVLAGIAQNAAELTDGHPSVQRCLREIPVDRMGTEDLQQIITIAERTIRSHVDGRWTPLSFDPDVKARIAELSFGYPYFTQLLASHAAQAAILAGTAEVTQDCLRDAVRAAVNDAEDDLKASLTHALREDDSSMFRNLLRSAAEVTATTLSARELREAVRDRTGEEYSAQQVNPYLRRLVSDKEDLQDIMGDIDRPKPIFLRIGDGQYRFFDPRMPSYIRLALSGSNDQSDAVPLLEI